MFFESDDFHGTSGNLKSRAQPKSARHLAARFRKFSTTSSRRAGETRRLPLLWARLCSTVGASGRSKASAQLGEAAKVLASHNAADRQTGAIGDVEVTLTGDDRHRHEMKTRRVTREDIDLAVQKILSKNIENYIFITTETVAPDVSDYARSLYEKTGGVEIAVLDASVFCAITFICSIANARVTSKSINVWF